MAPAPSLICLAVAALADGGGAPNLTLDSDSTVAVVGGRTIRLRDSDPRLDSSASPQQDIQVLERVIAALLELWAAAGKLEPTRAEIDAFLLSLGSVDAERLDPKDSHARRFAEGWLWVRKSQRALHQRYGGRVIWQQTGPEAVGAYLPFLLDEERAGHLRFPDARWRARIFDIARNFPGIDIPAESLDEALDFTPAAADGGVRRNGRDAGR